ncbi:unnamed protein product [Leptidea sinapis]|uniref:Uncharacterized protein n=1 Tax=Leptidea sinapis TaxID=189913 RepID=A0A5E4Q3S1_9NEOP|nr:unnamed protein product [Leptidea sinapis]
MERGHRRGADKPGLSPRPHILGLIIDPRKGEVESEAIAHEGSKASRAIFLKHGLVFTTGFSRMSERQYSLRTPDALAEPIVT